MNTQKYTDGPWRLETDYPKGFLILKDEPHPSHDPVWTVANVNACMGAESKSNARLIAAAPDLLQATKDFLLLAAFHDWEGAAIDFAKATLAKAEGNI